MLEMFLMILNFIFVCIKFLLACVIVFLPIIMSLSVYILLFLKDNNNLKKLRNETNYGSNKWRKVHLDFFADEVYNLGINDYLKEFNKPKYYLRKLLIAFLCLLVASNISYVLSPQLEYTTYTRDLYAFEDNQGFYLRGGAFRGSSGNDELVYYYTLKNGDDFKSYRVESYMASITYTETSPKVEYTKSKQRFSKGKWYESVVSYLIKTDESKNWTLKSVRFYIPKGSVQNTYNSDLK